MSSSPAPPGLRRRARFLGLVSLGLGAATLGRPRELARFSGVDDSEAALQTLPLVGAHELFSAAGLLQGRPGWAWTRVAGDAMDLASMGVALGNRKGERQRRLRNVTIGVSALAALDLVTALRSARSRSVSRVWKNAIDVSAAVTVNRPVPDVYRFWRDLENLPAFMAHVRKVRTRGLRSHWVAEAPGRRLQWDAEIVEDRPGRLIRWRAVDHADVQNAGWVEFAPAPGNRGTEVRVHLSYAQPGGRFGKRVAGLFGESPEQQVRDDLARLKQVLETGQVVRSEGSPEGPLARRLVAQRSAVPVS